MPILGTAAEQCDGGRCRGAGVEPRGLRGAVLPCGPGGRAVPHGPERLRGPLRPLPFLAACQRPGNPRTLGFPRPGEGGGGKSRLLTAAPPPPAEGARGPGAGPGLAGAIRRGPRPGQARSCRAGLAGVFRARGGLLSPRPLPRTAYRLGLVGARCGVPLEAVSTGRRGGGVGRAGPRACGMGAAVGSWGCLCPGPVPGLAEGAVGPGWMQRGFSAGARSGSGAAPRPQGARSEARRTGTCGCRCRGRAGAAAHELGP